MLTTSDPTHVRPVGLRVVDLETDAPGDAGLCADLATALGRLTEEEVEHERIQRLEREDQELVARVDADHDAAMRGVAAETMTTGRAGIEAALRRAFPGADPATARQTLRYRLDARIAEEIRARQRVEAARVEVRRHELALAHDRFLRATADTHAAATVLADCLVTRGSMKDEIHRLGGMVDGLPDVPPVDAPGDRLIADLAGTWVYQHSTGANVRSIAALKAAGLWPSASSEDDK